ncbi:carbon-nitrogen hydrolase [Rhodobacteraceae bacterium Araon29]
MSGTDKEMILGLWQGVGVPGDVASNIDNISRIARQAAAEGVKLLVFPECFLTGYFTLVDIAAIAAQVDDLVFDQLASIADEYDIALVVGSYEASTQGTCNAAFVVHPGIGLVGTYRKRMLYGDWEKRTFQQGTKPLTFTWKGLTVGVLICFDLEFPERARELANLGVDLIVTPTALMEPYENVLSLLVPTRALENGIYVGYANRINREEEFEYVGGSCIVSPDGNDMARAARAKQGLLTAKVSNMTRLQVTSKIDYLSELANEILSRE